MRRDIVETLLRRFRRGLDKSGIAIPMPIPPVGYDMGTTEMGAIPLSKDFPLMALAQHHGVPTFLLDWTRRPRTAAYFAAHAAALGAVGSETTHMAVWALEMRTDLHREYDGSKDLFFRYYEAPSSTNPNLLAQNGLFTLHWANGGELSLEESFATERTTNPTQYVPQLRRFTVKKSEARRVLKLLADEGVDGASLFPGPDGVVRAMKERAGWQS